MGQYYLIVNLTKKQFLYPHCFNDGLKLKEFGCSSQGTMMALAVLLADGNGRGGGDVFSQAYREEEERYKNHKRKTFPDAQKYNDLLIGSWAGDKIVVAGDYGDPYKYLTKQEIRRYERIYKNTEPEDRHRFMKNDTNLFGVASKLYEDISEKILKVLVDAGGISEKRDSIFRR